MEIYSRIGYKQSCVDVRDLSHMVWGPTFLYLPACWETGTGSGTDWYLKLISQYKRSTGQHCLGILIMAHRASTMSRGTASSYFVVVSLCPGCFVAHTKVFQTEAYTIIQKKMMYWKIKHNKQWGKVKVITAILVDFASKKYTPKASQGAHTSKAFQANKAPYKWGNLTWVLFEPSWPNQMSLITSWQIFIIKIIWMWAPNKGFPCQ